MGLGTTIYVNAEGVAQVAQQFVQLGMVIRQVADRLTMVGSVINNNVNKQVQSMQDVFSVPKFKNFNAEMMSLGNITRGLELDLKHYTNNPKISLKQQEVD